MNLRSKVSPVVSPVSILAPAEILAQLERVLESPPFKTSRRCSDLLRHVVEGACEGRKELLKERTLGVAVFERNPDYDTNQDPVVRNTAGQVRKRLAQYYCEAGRDQEVRIELPPGAYIPEIYKPISRIPAPVEVPPQNRRFNWRFIAISAAVIALVGGAVALSRRHTDTAVELFWGPMVKLPDSVVLCVGQGHVYKLKGDLDRLFEKDSKATPTQTTIPVSDVIPTLDRYIGLNDAQSVTRFTAMFTRLGKEVELRGGRSTSLADLRGRPIVLIGGFNNEWTLNLTGELRFYFQEDPGRKVDFVRDRLHPGNRDWEVRMDIPTTQIGMDYAIVSRVFNPTTEQAVVVAAGITGGGTNAAGEFLTTPAYLEQALRGAPPHWEEKNVQYVLAARMFSGHPGPAKVVAAHYW